MAMRTNGIGTGAFALAFALSGSTLALPEAVFAQTQESMPETRSCEFRYTEIRLNSFGLPGSRAVSDEERTWAEEQRKRKARGEPCVLPEAATQEAGGAADAAAHNTLYGRKLANALPAPATVTDMLRCSAVWDRWTYAVQSAADPAFRDALRTEISVRNAESRQHHWRRMARKEARGDGDGDDDAFDSSRDIAEREADEIYSKYASGGQSETAAMMGWLATCR